jgi:hypothetical protein
VEASDKNIGSGQAVVASALNPSTWEAEAGGFLSSRPAWSTEGRGGEGRGGEGRSREISCGEG